MLLKAVVAERQTRYPQEVVSLTCGFKSHQPHQFDWAIAKWLRHRILTPRPRVRPSLALPKKTTTDQLWFLFAIDGKKALVLFSFVQEPLAIRASINSYGRQKGYEVVVINHSHVI